ncbi:MAG: FAD-dependent oxidoreductase [Gammaproteobacteria bacterium]|nr:FAD-dependent oxidoreductase [Gammaproteobacteria bacterium]
MSDNVFDILIIGGGIQGAGVAQAAVAAGYHTCLLEKTAIASATSSRSSKLIHGGLRYLESGQFSLVRKALYERDLLLRMAPELVKAVPFYIPVYKNSSRPAWKIRLGLMLYAVLGGFKQYTAFKEIKSGFKHQLAGLREDDLSALYQYWDAQTDDAALTRSVVQSAKDLGLILICPAGFESAVYQQNHYQVSYTENAETKQVYTRFIVNAAGPWVNHVLDRIKPEPEQLMIDLVQGAHIILDVKAGESIYYLEAPQNQRAVFVMPWKGKTLVGTTETEFNGDLNRIEATEAEIRYLQAVYQYYFPSRSAGLLDSFAGVRVLPKTDSSYFNRPRDTVLQSSGKNILTMYGGKLTGYRATAQQVIKKIKADLPERKAIADTRNIELKPVHK